MLQAVVHGDVAPSPSAGVCTSGLHELWRAHVERGTRMGKFRSQGTVQIPCAAIKTRVSLILPIAAFLKVNPNVPRQHAYHDAESLSITDAAISGPDAQAVR